MASIPAAIVAAACIAGTPDPAWPGTCVTDATWHTYTAIAPMKGGRDTRPATGVRSVPVVATGSGGGRGPLCPHAFQEVVPIRTCRPEMDPAPVPLPPAALLLAGAVVLLWRVR